MSDHSRRAELMGRVQKTEDRHDADAAHQLVRDGEAERVRQSTVALREAADEARQAAAELRSAAAEARRANAELRQAVRELLAARRPAAP